MNTPSDPVVDPSYFRSRSDRSPMPISWNQVLGLITKDEAVRMGTLASREARRAGDTKRADDLKARCGAITASAACVGGHAKKHITALTGKLALDFDHIPVDRMAEVERLAKEDTSTYLAYVTNSGNGLRIIVRYTLMDGATYRDAFETAARHYEKMLGVEADRKVCDESRLSYLSHDPAAVFHPSAPAFSVIGLTLIDRAREAVEAQGYVFRQHYHNEYVWHVAVWMRDHAVPLAEAMHSMQGAFGNDYPATPAVVRSVYANDPHSGNSRPAEVAAGGARKGKASVTDIKRYLSGAVRLRRNLVTHELEIGEGDDGWRLLSDTDVNSLWVHMCEEGCEARLDDICAVIRSDATPSYDPFRTYFDALPPWNPDSDPDYIGQLAARVHTTAGADYFERCFRKWFVGIPAALFTDATNHVVLVFLGRQGIYKTTFFQRLLPPEWQKRYFFTKTNSQVFDKDDKITMASHVLINLEEIDRMSPTELNQLKAAITDKDIHVRPPYGHGPEHFRHIASFCGTGNNLRFLTDPTGNRRWLPFEVLSIDNPYDYTLPYEGLYAQAYYLLNHDFCYWFTQEELVEQALYNAPFEAPNSEVELVEKYFSHPRPGDPGVFLTATDIVDYLGTYTTLRNLSSIRVGRAMATLGYEKKAGSGRYGYYVIKNDLEQIRRDDQITGNESDVPF